MNIFSQCALELDKATRELPKKIADQGVMHVKQHIIDNGQVDTGTMRDSVESEEINQTEARFFVGVDYGVYQNYGTRYLPPRPFWEPGVMETEIDLDTEMDNIAKRLENIK